eukprot:gnl/MRDRNA2_/MRDRNA2_47344_c0_seq1.p1 gnl/MRDRNA2_/MRDRNA2_47344_c0~~gnl/MRDRNA2_/MRDRNA2_47344_c0_seq1.p1  ORF type:complete len:181 (-),score=30.10 gnl/MRDRNA2_/MRDRNA2_47344_c0_seq1:32-574(-)
MDEFPWDTACGLLLHALRGEAGCEARVEVRSPVKAEPTVSQAEPASRAQLLLSYQLETTVLSGSIDLTEDTPVPIPCGLAHEHYLRALRNFVQTALEMGSFFQPESPSKRGGKPARGLAWQPSDTQTSPGRRCLASDMATAAPEPKKRQEPPRRRPGASLVNPNTVKRTAVKGNPFKMKK